MIYGFYESEIRGALREIAAQDAADHAIEKRRAALQRILDACNRARAELLDQELLKQELLLVLENLQGGLISFDVAVDMCKIIGVAEPMPEDEAEICLLWHDHKITRFEMLERLNKLRAAKQSAVKEPERGSSE